MDDLLVGDDGCRSSFDSQDSNDEDYYANDYPDEEDESTSCKEGYYGAEPDDYGYAAYDRDAGDDDWGLGGRLCSGSYGPSSNSGSEDGPSFRFS